MQNEKLDPLALNRGMGDASSTAGKLGPLAAAAGLLGAAIGWGLSRYSGPALWIPGGATVLLSFLFVKTPFRPKFFAGAISVTSGHVIWFLVGCATTGQWSLAALDIVLLSLGVFWLCLSPGLMPALFLGIVQVASLIVNVISLVSFAPGSPEHRTLTVHCVWRLLAIYCLARGYLYMRKALAARAAAAEETTATND
jgi:hypothetical protein